MPWGLEVTACYQSPVPKVNKQKPNNKDLFASQLGSRWRLEADSLRSCVCDCLCAVGSAP